MGIIAFTADGPVLSSPSIADGSVEVADLSFDPATQTELNDALALKAPLASPTFTGTVAGVTKTMVGLGNVDNTSDANKPVSTATQTALDLKAPLASPALTGNPTAPTPAAADNDTSIATTAYVQTELGSFVRTAQSVNAQTGTTYTLVAGDAGKLVTLSNGSAITLTLPQDSDATIAVGTYVDLYALGAGQVTVVAGTGATLRTSGLTAKSRAQYARFGVQKVSANTWSLFGDLAAS